MNGISTKPYIECVAKKCKSVDNAISFAVMGTEILQQIGKKGPPSRNDIGKIRYFAKNIKNHKVNIKDAKCSLEKCGKEYVKMTEQSLVRLASEMENVASSIERYIEKSETKQSSRGSTKSKQPTKTKTVSKKTVVKKTSSKK